MTARRTARPPTGERSIALPFALRRKLEERLTRELDDPNPLFIAALIVTPVVAAALFYVWAQMITVRTGYALSRAGEEHQRLIEQNRSLRVQVAALKGPERLKGLAETRYLLAPPSAEQVTRVEPRRKPGR